MYFGQGLNFTLIFKLKGFTNNFYVSRLNDWGHTVFGPFRYMNVCLLTTLYAFP